MVMEHDDDTLYCDRCERYHRFCECDEFAYLGTHSWHGDPPRSNANPHHMESY